MGRGSSWRGGWKEITWHTSELCLHKWIQSYFDTAGWEFFDLSCIHRDATDDACLPDAVEAGKRISAIFNRRAMES